MVPLGEETVAKEMEKAPIGVLMHDGWFKVLAHYFAFYVSYNWIVGRLFVPTSVLLPMAPLPKVYPEEDSN